MDEYVRYGEQWKKEMMRNKKEDIVRMFSEAMKEKEEYATEKCIEQKEIDMDLFESGSKKYSGLSIRNKIRKSELATDK